jgi:hypothetical protein
MEHDNPMQNTTASPNLQSQPQQQPAASRGRGRRQYAAQQYDFNAPAASSMYDQPPQYATPGYFQQGQQPPVPSMAQPQYGQEFPGPAPNAYAPGYQGQPSVVGMTNQFQQMHVSQVESLCLLLMNHS